MTLAVDVSNWTRPELTADHVRAWRAAGVGLVVVQAVDPPPGYPRGVTREQLDAARNGGVVVDAYVYLWFGNPSVSLRNLLLLDGERVRRVWLDIEDAEGAARLTQGQREAIVDELLDACDRYGILPAGIYTGRWFWRPYMADTPRYASRPLWDSRFDGIPDVSANWVPYGGWTERAIKQYAGDASLGGVSGIDLNVVSEGEVVRFERETPESWPWPTWFESAVNYKGIADALGQQLEAERQRYERLRERLRSILEEEHA